MPASRFPAASVALLLAALLAPFPLRGDDLFAQLGDAARNGRLEAEAKLRAGSVPVMKGYAITVKGTPATRLDVAHVAMARESLIGSAERRFGVNRHHIAPETVFMSHETFTPARGGSAAAEVAALRQVFGQAASEIVMANTKGFTGHPMGVGIEDVIAVKILEHGIVPPVPNFKEVDPDLGPLTLSRGGRYPVKYAIHLAAGFGSQVAMTLTRLIPGSGARVDNAALYQKWLDNASGYDRAELEVVKRTLRVVSRGVPARTPEPTRWAWGTGPVMRAPVAGESFAANVGGRMCGTCFHSAMSSSTQSRFVRFKQQASAMLRFA